MAELAVTVKVSELLARVQHNREQHRKIFDEAVEGFKAAMIEELEARLVRVRAGKLVEMAIRLPVPEDHTIDYDRVIDMLEMHTSEQLEIDAADFANFVRDDWAWKRQFIQTASNYTASAR